jgi:hypothetical protein
MLARLVARHDTGLVVCYGDAQLPVCGTGDRECSFCGTENGRTFSASQNATFGYRP